MSSNGNKTSDGTSFQPSKPAPCANGCGFFGTAATMNLCSKCYGDLRINEEQTASAMAAVEKLVNQNQSSSVDGRPSRQSQSSPETSDSRPTTAVDTVSGGEDAGQQAAKARCLTCKRKVGLTGFRCRCENTFCGTHRYPERHDCEFDFKGLGREAIARANPVVKSDKIQRF